jgi:hypothetical protein
MIKIREKGLKTLGMALLLIVFSANHREQEFIPDLKERLEEFNSVFHNEKAYLFTAGNILPPGEIISSVVTYYLLTLPLNHSAKIFILKCLIVTGMKYFSGATLW